MRSEVVRRVAPLAVATAVLAVVGVAWLAGRTAGPGPAGPGGGAAAPEPLHLASWVAPGETTADPRYRLAPGANLPDGPSESSVFTVRPQPERRSALAGALGHNADRLVVQPDGRWSLGSIRCVLHDGDTPVSSDEATAVDCPSQGPLPQGDGRELDAARPVLEAVGLGDEPVHVDDPAGNGGTAIVRVDPKVDGRPTDGWSTWLEVAGSRVVSAQGWLATTGRGPSYPVVSARTAYEEFVRTPHPMPMIACPEPAPQDGDLRLLCGGPVTMTGAEFGLSLQASADGPLLVPSWLFSVEGSAQPLVQVAVAPRLLVQGHPDGGTGGMEQGTATAKPLPSDSVAPYPTMPAN